MKFLIPKYKFDTEIPLDKVDYYIGLPIASIYTDKAGKIIQKWCGINISSNRFDVNVRWPLLLHYDGKDVEIDEIKRIRWRYNNWDDVDNFTNLTPFKTLTREEYKRYKTYVLERSFKGW